jgi:putative ABC transport system permease protein
LPCERFANKLRSALTVLGIVVGVAAVVCMVSVGAGAQAEVSEKIRTLGANLLLVIPGARNSGGARLESGTQPTLTEEDAAAIRCELVDAQVAAPLLSRSMSLVAANKNWMTVVAGINADYLVAREWQVTNGRSFTSDEVAAGAKVALVGSVIIDAMSNARAVRYRRLALATDDKANTDLLLKLADECDRGLLCVAFGAAILQK